MGHLGGAPLRIHWTTPLGAYLFCGGSFVPVSWGAFVMLVVLHELGHAFLVRRFRLQVIGIQLHALGGECHWSGFATDDQRSVIAWGGVLAQGVVFALTYALWPLLPPSMLVAEVVPVWTGANLVMIAFNLIPMRPFDGAQAWKLFRWSRLRALWSKGRRTGRRAVLRGKARQIERQLDALEGILEDDQAPHRDPRDSGAKLQ